MWKRIYPHQVSLFLMEKKSIHFILWNISMGLCERRRNIIFSYVPKQSVWKSVLMYRFRREPFSLLTHTGVMKFCFHKNCENRRGKRQRKYQIWLKARNPFQRFIVQNAKNVPCGRHVSQKSNARLSHIVRVFGMRQ